MISSHVVESDPVPVFDDTVSFTRVPIAYEVLGPGYPLVNKDFWCGDGRWTVKGAKHYWSRRDDRN